MLKDPRSNCSTGLTAPRKRRPRCRRRGDSLAHVSSVAGRHSRWRTALELIIVELPGVIEDGMSGRSGQRKPGTTCGSPRRSRTAKALRISRSAAKSWGACEWDGWGRLSDDGAGQHNPIRSEGPWGRWRIPPHGGAVDRVDRSDFGRINAEARRAKTNRTSGSVCREQA